MRPTVQASDGQRYVDSECPSSCSAAGPPVSTRTVLHMYVMGWCSAKACIQPGMVRDRHVGRRAEAEREHEERQTLRRLRAPGEEAHGDEQPDEGEAVQHGQPERRQRTRGRAADAEPDGEADRRHDDDAPGHEGGIGTHPPRHDGEQPDRQRAQPVEEAAWRSSATPLLALMPWKSTPVTTKPGTRKSTYDRLPVTAETAPPKT